MNLISFVNHKGGTGKTTACVNLAAGLAIKKFQTLLIDLDPQANATLSLGVDPTNIDLSTYQVLMGQASLNDIVISTLEEKLSLAPAKIDLAHAEINLASQVHIQFKLKDSLGIIKANYDYVLIDCPPSLSLLTVNALAASHGVIIPILCDYLSLEGLKQLILSIEEVKRNLNPKLKILGILPNGVDYRLRITKESLNMVREHFKDLVFHNVIRTCVKLKEAPSFRKSIYTYAPDSTATLDYKAVLKELLKRGG